MNQAENTVHLCSICGTESPPSSTDYSLISAKHGWRLVREPDADADGGRDYRWFCPTCWARRRSINAL